ncbi:MAG: ATP-binding protein [Anaerolineae bacterium]
MDQRALPGYPSGRHRSLIKVATSIGAKIILPYLLLTLVVAGVGAYILTSLVASSMYERFNNQLLDAGRVVSESMVRYEADRLAVLRAVAGTQGVPEALAAGDRAALARLVPQIIANSKVDAVELLDGRGIEVFGWQRPPGQDGPSGEERSGADYSQLQDVRLVLEGYVDDFGEKRVLLSQTPHGLMIFTIGPVYLEGERVGAAMVGIYVREMLVELTESAVAKVTLYDRNGTVVGTTMAGGQEAVAGQLREPPEQYERVMALLAESPDRYQVVVAEAAKQVPLRQVEILGQQYVLAFGDWRLRNQSFGLFSVALPSNFIVSTAATSRGVLSLIFSLATVAVITIGFLIARRIIHPLNRLVETSVAVASGDLEQRTGIRRSDEIGSLASSFDVMTEKLAERNRQLVEQASELEAILNSIADGVIVLDRQGQIITTNPAAQQVLAEMASNFPAGPLRELPPGLFGGVDETTGSDQLSVAGLLQTPHRYRVGSRVLSALAAPVVTPGGDELGTVVVLRDISREVESEQLKDAFITSISHELRTPLTAIKGYSDLLLMTADGSLDERRLEFVHTISDNTNQLLRHINTLIDISQIQAGNLGLEKERLRFSELVGEVVEKWRGSLETKGLALRVRFSGGSLWVRGDRERLQWAVDNLLSNAYNYTLPGGRVEVRVFGEGGQARVDVTDTGVGVAAEDQPYLFTRFFRAHNELTFSVRGVGLGLFITRSIVELHGGQVWAESELGVGSTFSIALPLIDDAHSV